MKNEKLLNKIEIELYKRLSDETVMSYLYCIKRFLAIYPNAQKLTLTEIETYFMELKKQGKSCEYRKVILASIKILFECLLEFEMIKFHPCRSYHIVEKRSKGKNFSSYLTMPEMESLLDIKEERFRYLGNRNKAMIGVLIYQGVTSKELIELKIEDIDLDSGTITIKGQRKNANRTLALKTNQIIVLMRYIEQDRPMLVKSKTNKLFIGKTGTPFSVDALHGFINKLSGAFNKDVSPLNIRNSVIHYWINTRKFPLERVQIMAGHCYPSSTEQYIQPDTQEQREAVTKLHKSIFG